MRFIGLDVHRDFCEVAIAEGGQVRLAGRVQTEPEELALYDLVATSQFRAVVELRHLLGNDTQRCRDPIERTRASCRS